MHKHATAKTQQPSEPRTIRSGLERWLAPALLSALVVLVLGGTLAGGNSGPRGMSVDAATGEAAWSPLPIIRHEVARWIGACVLGVLAPLGLQPLLGRLPGRWRGFGWVVALAFVWLVIASWMAVEWGHLPSLNAMLLPWALAAVGVGIGTAATSGWRTLAWAVGGLVGGVAIVMGLGWIVMSAALSESPLEFERMAFDTTEKNLLVTRLRESRPAPDEPRVLTLRQDEVAGLLNSLLLRLGSQHKGRVELVPGASVVEVSLVGPASWPRQCLNVHAVGDIDVEDGRIAVDVSRLTAGDVPLPWPITGAVAGLLETLAHDEHMSRTVIEVVSNMRVLPGEVEVLFNAKKVGQDILASLIARVWGRPNVAPETEIYVARLLDAVQAIPAGEDRFGRLMQEAFTLAAERSADADPRLENRAAILGLAIVLGHEGIEQLVGQVLTPEQRQQLPRVIGTAQLRGRQDWARHFLVSAATKLLSDRTTSDAIGIFKESIDSQAGGSGFSFADLLANMAGMRFAEVATSSPEAARGVQRGLSAGFDVAAVFPFADDLPEGITAEAFQSDYGGVEGAAYARVVRELEYRLDDMPKLGK